jgi:hypothetical protein
LALEMTKQTTNYNFSNRCQELYHWLKCNAAGSPTLLQTEILRNEQQVVCKPTLHHHHRLRQVSTMKSNWHIVCSTDIRPLLKWDCRIHQMFFLNHTRHESCFAYSWRDPTQQLQVLWSLPSIRPMESSCWLWIRDYYLHFQCFVVVSLVTKPFDTSSCCKELVLPHALST